MRITDARIKVSFTTEEDRALRTTRDILEKLKVKYPMDFLIAYSNKDWIYNDDGTVFEILDNQNEPEDDT